MVVNWLLWLQALHLSLEKEEGAAPSAPLPHSRRASTLSGGSWLPLAAARSHAAFPVCVPHSQLLGRGGREGEDCVVISGLELL